MKDSHTLHLVRKFLQAGIMENGLVTASTIGTPQGDHYHQFYQIFT